MLDANYLPVIDGAVNAWGDLSVDGKSGKYTQQERQGEQGTTPSKG
jgi:hypothetical protein